MESSTALFNISPTVAREYLLTTASSLRATLAPDFPGDVNARINDCVQMLARVAQQLTAPSPAVAGLLGNSGAADVVQEGLAIDATEAELAVLLKSIDAAAHTATKSFDQNRFERYLQQHALGSPGLRIVKAKPLQGGRSKQTVLISLENQGEKLPGEIVLRQDWNSSVTGTSVVTEFELVREAHDAGLNVARPLLLEASSEALGAPFVVVTRLPGRGEGMLFMPPRSESLALQLAEQLGKLHALPAQRFVNLSGVSTRAHTREQLRSELQGYRGLYQQLDRPSPTLDTMLQYLESNIDNVKGELALTHTDIGFHNLLVDGDRLTGVLDWELAHLGNPAEDLGYCRGDIELMTTWPRFMQAYRAAGGPEITQKTLDFYTIWGAVRLYCLLLQARYAIGGGLLRDAEVAHVVMHLMPMLVHRMSQQMRTIIEKS